MDAWLELDPAPPECNRRASPAPSDLADLRRPRRWPGQRSGHLPAIGRATDNADHASSRPRARRSLAYDLPAGLVVFLIAVPLCLGIAFASGAPLLAGLVTGIVGGLVVARVSKSSLAVSGPAAGLFVIVQDAITDLGSYEAFLTAVCLAGVIQLIAGSLRAGIIAYSFPSSVIKGCSPASVSCSSSSRYHTARRHSGARRHGRAARRAARAEGPTQSLPFVITVLGIVFTDLLTGVLVGLAVGIFFVLRAHVSAPYYLHEMETESRDGGQRVRIVLGKNVTFLNKASLDELLQSVNDGSEVEIDASSSRYLDHERARGHRRAPRGCRPSGHHRGHARSRGSVKVGDDPVDARRGRR